MTASTWIILANPCTCMTPIELETKTTQNHAIQKSIWRRRRCFSWLEKISVLKSMNDLKSYFKFNDIVVIFFSNSELMSAGVMFAQHVFQIFDAYTFLKHLITEVPKVVDFHCYHQDESFYRKINGNAGIFPGDEG